MHAWRRHGAQARYGAVSEAEIAERVARESYGRLLALLAARTRDLAAAEDALADAFAAALTAWPRTGAPDNPEAWLFAAARRKLIDAARRAQTAHAAQDALTLAARGNRSRDARDTPDRRLDLMFACAHPDIEPGARTPLMLQTVLGLSAERIAAAFLVAPPAMSQRLVRAKKRIAEARISLKRLRLTNGPRASPPCSMLCTPPTPMAGAISAPTPNASRWRRRGFGSGACWWRKCRTSLRRSACSR